MKPTDFFRALDLPADPLKPGFRRPRASRSNHYAVFNAEEILTEATLSRFHALGLRLGTAALFHKKPGSMGIIHDDVALHDGRWRKNVAAINWNLSGADSLMRWYRIAAPGNVPDPEPPADAGPWYRTLNGIHYGFFGARERENLPTNQVEILAEAFIGSATLVRTNLPHAVENTDPTRGRWALSVRFEPDFNSWAAANAALKPLWAAPHRPSRLSVSSPRG